MAYCQSNPEACKDFISPGGGWSGGDGFSGGVPPSGFPGGSEPPSGGFPPPPDGFQSGGPGGCINKEECIAYCTAHYTDSVCVAYTEGGGGTLLPSPPPTQKDQPQYPPSQPPMNFSGPGGCKSIEECTAYCTKNYQDSACWQF